MHQINLIYRHEAEYSFMDQVTVLVFLLKHTFIKHRCSENVYSLPFKGHIMMHFAHRP